MDNQFEHTSIPIAVTGMACRLPGADNLEQFWEMLRSGGCAVVELPHERLDQELYYRPKRGTRGKSYSKLGAIVNSRQFDRQACPIPPRLERGVDNAHLLMCQTACEALRKANLDPFNVPLRNTGVYIGHAQGSNLAGDVIYHTCIDEAAQFLREVDGFQQLSTQDQDDIIRELVDAVRSEVPALDADSPDVATNMIAGVIAKAFRLSGPFASINSACASSLHSILLAARALQLGRVDMAIAGGASDCKSDSLVLFSHAQSLSETGTRPFDAGADGLICGEGYAAVVLKTLPRALADGDPIQAVLLGFGVSSDGRGKSLWAPRKEGQVKAMERAYRHGLDMATLQYVEAHATSTPLGDATELNALGEILGASFPPGKKVPISSVKANIGHALETAGVSSLIKTVLCLQHRSFVPAINVRELNPKINWESAPFYIPLEAGPWPEQPDGSARRAAVNAFGIGGLNMHVVVEEFTEDRRAALAARYAEPDKHAPAGAPRRTDDDRQAVAIIGMGCIFPDAPHPAKFWELITAGRDPKGPTPAGRWRSDLAYTPGARRPYGTPTILGGYITGFAYDWRAHKLPPKQIEQADPLQFMLLEAADQALQDSGYDKKEFDRTRVGVLVGSEYGSDFGTQLELGLRLPHIESILHKSFSRRGVAPQVSSQITEQLATVLLKHWPALIDESGSFSTSTLASRITKTMNLMGGAAAIDAGSASAAAVLSISIDQLLSGDCDMMICAGGQRHMNLPLYIGSSLSGVLSTSDRPRTPFDAEANGIVPGEGVGAVILKRLCDAQRDGDRIHAIIRGVGAGHSEDAGEGLRLAMSRAFDIAGVDPSDVALIEMDGVGLPESDQEQLRAVVTAYGRSKRDEPLLLGSITAQIGHTAGASAMASLIKATFEVETGQMPATFGLDSPLPIVAQNAEMISTATKSVPIRHTTHDGRRFAAVSSSSKGQAYHILLERGQRVPISDVAAARAADKKPLVGANTTSAAVAPVAAAQPAADCRIYRVGAATQGEIAAKLERALADPAAAFAAAGGTRFAQADHARLAIVAGSVDALAKKMQLAAKQFSNPDARTVLEQQGCFYRQVPMRKPRIAFLFSGQGSHYAGMLRELVRDVPAAAAAMRKVDEIMTQRGYQTFAQMAWEHPEQLGTDVWSTQVVMLLADIIVHAAVTEMGIKPDLVAGHSYGEFAALTAADAWDLEGVVTAARARYDAIEATPTARGTLMATTAPPTAIEQAAATLSERTHIANYNAPDQTVVGGSPQALAQLAQQLSGQGHKAQMLTVPCPYHTPLLEGAGGILKRTLDSLRMRPPRVPLLSTVTNKYVSEPEEIRANLAAQLTTPVRYIDLINRIADEQDTVFIEIGPQQALTKLNRRILDGRSTAGVIATDNAKRPGVEQLVQVRAMLECLDLFGEPAPASSSEPAVARPTEVAAIRSSQPAMTKPAKGTITHFDATQRRIEKKRQMASGTPQTGNGRQPAPVSPTTPGPNGDDRNGGQTRAAQSAPIARYSGMPSHAPAPAPVAPRTTAPAPAPAPIAPPAASAPAATSPGGGLEPAELEKFLVNFVVEQTGYPPEVVELDADLEADLGIDSIKKAQLFGELAEYFDVQPDENLSLDDFPTLRHVVNFLAGAQLKGDLPGGATTATAPAPPALAAPAVAPAPAPPVRPAAAPAPAVAVSPAPAPAPIAPPTAVSAPATASPGGGLEPAELEKFLVNFVVEQTGYPPEVVELDADLEADLGIDSIKKAQLFGELAEYFDVQPDENLSLDDFPTLRHVVNFLAGSSLKKNLTPNQIEPIEPDSVAISARSAPPALSAPATAPTGNGASPAPRAAAPSASAAQPSGSPHYEAGLARGRQQRVEIIRRLREYADLAGPDFDDLPASHGADADPTNRFRAAEIDELHGLAAGVQVSPAAVLAHGRDLLSGNGAAVLSVAPAHAAVETPVAPIEPPVIAGPEYDLSEEDSTNDETHRFYLRQRACPFDEPAPAMPQWNGAALIVGECPLGDALGRLLESAGVTVRRLPISDDLDETLASFDRIWSEQPTPHLFIVTGREPAADPGDDAAWRRRWHRVAVVPYFLCQRWVQRAGEAKMLDGCSVVAATNLNGTLGLSGKITSPECGALTGLVKAIYIELAVLRNQQGLRTKAIDAPPDEPPDSLAASICRELGSKAVDYEVAFVGGNRFVQYAYPLKAPVQGRADIRVGGTWVITGGARGITAECAMELGRRFGLKLHLIGISPLREIDPSWRNLSLAERKVLKTNSMREARAAGRPVAEEWNRVQRDIEIDRSMRAYAAAGVDVTYHVCNVADPNALVAVLDAIRRTSGAIEGIIHGAGVERSGSFERKQRESVMATIEAKVDGALNLIRLTRQDPLRWFIGFGSISGRLGGYGQTDYCLASDALCRLVSWFRTERPEVHSIGFHWHSWDEVGMAARPESAAAVRIAKGPVPMPKREGLHHFIRELYAGAPEGEVLITSWEYHGRYYGDEDHPKPDAPGSNGAPRAAAKTVTPAEGSYVQSTDASTQAAPWERVPFEPVVSRHELNMVAAPLPPDTPAKVQWQGPACILGDNPTALALRDALAAAGVRVHMLPASNSPDEAAAAMEAIYAADPPRYLFLLSGRDAFAGWTLDRAGWQQRRARGVVAPFRTAQHWFKLRMKAKDKTPVTIVAATSLGGDFGLSRNVALPDGGALAGMLKSIYIEDTRLSPSEARVKVIDAPADEPPATVVEAIFRELAANDPNVEVGWSRGQRSVVRSLVRPVESLPRRTVPRGGNWLITGGARGITAAVALELGRRYGLKLHLIGRSPAPRDDAPWRNCNDEELGRIKSDIVREAIAAGRSPQKEWDPVKHDIEIHGTLQKLAEAGIEAKYYSCEMADWTQLEATIEQIRHHGPIEGIVHGAGYGKAARFAARSMPLLERTLAGKLDGAVALMSLTRQDPVRYFIGFGSIGGRYGGNGFSDYAAANDMFAKLCSWYQAQQPDRAVCCCDWQTWDEIGMAIPDDVTVGTKSVLKMQFIPPPEGVEHLCRELEAGLPSTEVMFTDRFWEKTFYPFIDGAAGALAARGSAGSVDIDAARLPLVETIAPFEASGGCEATIVFNPTADPFLVDHQLRGKPLMPAVIGLEAVAEASRLACGQSVVAISNVELIEGLLFHTDRTLEARVRTVRQDDGTFVCELLSDFRNRADKLIKKDRLHLRAVAEVSDAPPSLVIPMPEPPSAMHAFEFQNDGALYHGPTLHGVKAITFDAAGGWGQLVALSLTRLGGTRTGRDWIVPATLLDAGFYVCGIHAWFHAGQVFSLPSSVERVQFGRMPRDNEDCLLTFECREIDPKQAVYDFTIFGEDRAAILHVRGHRVVMLRP